MPDTFPTFMNFRDGVVQGPLLQFQVPLNKGLKSVNFYRFKQLVAELQCNLLFECGTIFFLVVLAKGSERRGWQVG
jgi:hypothetical protein